MVSERERKQIDELRSVAEELAYDERMGEEISSLLLGPITRDGIIAAIKRYLEELDGD